MYPRKDVSLVPLILRPALGARPVPIELVKRYGLPKGLRLADLDDRAWTDFPSHAINALANAVIAAFRLPSTQGYNHAQLVSTRPLSLDELELSARSRNALIWAGLIHDGELQPTTLGRLVSAPNLGAIALLDILTEIERLEDTEGSTLEERARTRVPRRLPVRSLRR